MKTPVTKEKLQNHLNYSLWKYALLVVLAVFGWNIIYTVTAYRPPEEKKVTLGMYTYGDATAATTYMQGIGAELLPTMEDMSAQLIMPDETYGDMVLATRIAARDCDIYLLPRDQFLSYAGQNAFMHLETVLPGLVADLEAAGVSLSRGYRADSESGEKHQYGIPCGDLPGAQTLFNCDTSDMYLAVFYETGNNDNVLIFFERLIRDLMVEPAVTE